jgi:hypothetical protein
MASAQCCSDFSGCVTLFKDFIAQRKSSKDAGLEMNISATRFSKKHVKFSDEQGGSKKVEDRYYKRDEYAKLSKEQKSALAKMREERGHVPGKHDGVKRKRDGKSGGKGYGNQTVAQLSTVIAALAARLDSNKDSQKDDSGSLASESSDEAPHNKQSGKNRDNKALTCQSGKKNCPIKNVSGLKTIPMVNIHKDRSELDSHMDTCVIGKNVLITHDCNRPVSTTCYDQSQGTTHRNMKTISAALAYDCPRTGQVIILMLHQAIHIPTMENNLLCPMQIRMNDIKVSETPKFLADNPTDKTHVITFHDGEASFIIPLSLDGVISFFPTRKPTMEEYNDDICFDLTYDSPVWDPHSTTFSERETDMVGTDGMVLDNFQPTRKPITLTRLYTNNMNLGQTLTAHAVSATTTTAEPGMSPAKLAKNWGIGLETARQTLKVTTKRGVRTVLHPSLSRCFKLPSSGCRTIL